MRILMTNRSLDRFAGTEMYLFDVARALRARGHEVIAYSPRLGGVAAELRAAGVAVVDDVAEVDASPDLIHGQHHLETMTALLHFSQAPAIYAGHDPAAWVDWPPRFPRLYRYLGHVPTFPDRMAHEYGIPPERSAVLPQPVDLGRFHPRSPLPPHPSRALVFSSVATTDEGIDAIRLACDRHGIALDVLGYVAGNAVARPEDVLGRYDLIFATGRAALEALAVGCAVIGYRGGRQGRMTTCAEVDAVVSTGFGAGLLRQPVSVAAVAAEIERYDAADTAAVSQQVREGSSLDHFVERLLGLYEDVRAEHASSRPLRTEVDERRAVVAYLALLTQSVDEVMHDFRGLRASFQEASRYVRDLERHLELRSAYRQDLDRTLASRTEYLASIETEVARASVSLADGLAYVESLECEVAQRRAYAQSLESGHAE